ncbi:capsule biosynthesis GfcC family protein [Vibrio stylophorae]|uniref:capsule biosynthesis GfcC family protein n=1 Tax=Vibrio stylophorae TaxID=659351 RepID=UPI00338ED5BF
MKLPFQATQSAKDYLEQASILRYMGLDEVYVIQPNGHLEIHTVAYWNENSRGIAPGAIILSPISIYPHRRKG